MLVRLRRVYSTMTSKRFFMAFDIWASTDMKMSAAEIIDNVYKN